jgi:hypothetical protein
MPNFSCHLNVEHGIPQRRIEMETRLTQIHTNDAKEREIRKYSRNESQHLRLKRTKIKLTDFRTVKVIGKGAFGEVRSANTIVAPLTKHRFVHVGAVSTESGHWQGLRDEELAESRNVETRSSTVIFFHSHTKLGLIE